MRINILACSNGVGITRDISIISNVLSSAGHDVESNHTYRFRPTHRYDINIHLERFNPRIFDVADKNVLIPNQEWYERSWLDFLSGFDCVFAKTRFAEKIFKDLGCKTEFIGFTSEDRYDPSIPKDQFHWIHIAGKSIQKQTETVIRTWAQNPGFPHLVIIQDPKFWRPRTLLKNVTFMIDHIPETVLKCLQNSSFVHVCPSETEGFGHYIVEAMSAQCLVMTTGAPPMNEIIQEDRGILIPPIRQEPMNLSTRFFVNEKKIEEAVIKIMIMDEGKKGEMARAARQFYLAQKEQFPKALVSAIQSL